MAGRSPTDATTRSTLHRLATFVVARRRYDVSGRFGLRASPGGFATPAFGEGPESLRVAGTSLVREAAGTVTTMAIGGTTLRALAVFADVDLDTPFSAGADTPDLGDPDAPLELDVDAAAALSAWYDLGWRALDETVGGLPASAEPATIQLWPEHFDAGTNVAVASGARVNLGFSPGDGVEPAPYAYVGPWGTERPGDPAYWNAPFGAVLRSSDVRAAADPTATAVAFLRAGLRAVAYELACAGAVVTVVDADHDGRASDAGAGIVSPETFHDPDEAWFSFGARAAAHLRTLVGRLAEDGAAPGPEAFAECGSVVVALAEHEDPWFAEVKARVVARSPEVTEIAPGAAQALFPPLGPVWRALHSPAAARVDGRLMRQALQTAARARGVTFRPMEVLGVENRGDRVTAVCGRPGTGHDVVPCGAVVVAGGAWSGRPGPWLSGGLPVTPTKGQIVHVVLAGASEGQGPGDAVGTRWPSDHWPIVQPILNFYLVPWPGGRVACGGTFEAHAGFDTRPTAAGLRDLLRECVAIAPGLGEATFSEVRVGLRPTTPDDRPLLGPLPGFANVHVCTGHGANGLLMGPYSAALVADALAGTSPSPAIPYGFDRFSSP